MTIPAKTPDGKTLLLEVDAADLVKAVRAAQVVERPLTVKELAARRGVHPNTIYRNKNKYFPTHEGKKILFSVRAIEEIENTKRK